MVDITLYVLRMKRLFSLIFVVFSFASQTVTVFAWDDCPFGLENDEYPGECGRYVDTNNDGICDHSQSEPIAEESSIVNEDGVPVSDSESVVTTEENIEEDLVSEANAEGNLVTKGKSQSPYNFFLPFSFSLVGYLTTWLLARKKISTKFTILQHNAIWNTTLLLSMIPSIVFGFHLVLRYTFPSIRTNAFDFLYWHVEGSIVMGTTAFLHLVQRLTTYCCQLKALWK